jgi:hypothetical protein
VYVSVIIIKDSFPLEAVQATTSNQQYLRSYQTTKPTCIKAFSNSGLLNTTTVYGNIIEVVSESRWINAKCCLRCWITLTREKTEVIFFFIIFNNIKKGYQKIALKGNITNS